MNRVFNPFSSALVILLCFGSNQAIGLEIIDYDAAKNRVKSQRCRPEENVDAFLSQKSPYSQRDLGWKVIGNDDGFDVERTFMTGKAMEIRYRWHVNQRGEIRPANRRAEELCS